MSGDAYVTLSMQWDPGMVVISYLVSVQAAYTALQILQMRISVWLIAVAALCLSVSGIWSMHFIGMAAMAVDADVTYNVGWTVASVFFAYIPTFAAFWILDAAMIRRRKRLLETSRLAEAAASNPQHEEGRGDDAVELLPTAIHNTSALIDLGHSSPGGPRSHAGGASEDDRDSKQGDINSPRVVRYHDELVTSFTTHTNEANNNTNNNNKDSTPLSPNREALKRAEAMDQRQVKMAASNFSADDLAEMEAEDTRDVSLAAHLRSLQQAPHLAVLFGGFLIALGACLMHYLGMHAMSMPGMEREIDVEVVVASCFIALFAGTAALYFAFVLPLTREFTVPTAMVAGAAVSGMHYVGMYGIRYRDPIGALRAAPHHSSTSIEPYVIYIIFASSAVSFASLSLSTHFYRQSLRKAADDAEERVDLIMEGKFDELAALSSGREDQSRTDPIMLRLKITNARLGEQMRKLRSFLPPSLLAQFEMMEGYYSAGEGEEDDDNDGDDDDEGDLSLRMSVALRPGVAGGASVSMLHHEASSNVGSSTQSPRSPPLRQPTNGGGGGVAGILHNTSAITALDIGGEMLVSRRISNGSEATTAANTASAAFASVRAGAGSRNHKGGGGGGGGPTTVGAMRNHYHLSINQNNVAVLALNCHAFYSVVNDSVQQFMPLYTNFMDGLCQVAKSQRGVLDIVHGDRVLMTFNASLKNASYGRRAAIAALHLARDIGAPGLRGCVAIGIATGPAKVGNMGSRQMMKYNVCGPVVGYAIKAQELAYELHADHGVHIISLTTQEMQMAVRTRAVDIVQWKHMREPAIVSEVVGTLTAKRNDEWMYELENFVDDDPFTRINKAFTTALGLLKRGEPVPRAPLDLSLRSSGNGGHPFLNNNSNSPGSHATSPTHAAGVHGAKGIIFAASTGGGSFAAPPHAHSSQHAHTNPPQGIIIKNTSNAHTYHHTSPRSFTGAAAAAAARVASPQAQSSSALNGTMDPAVVIAPSLCCNCTSTAKRTLGEMAAYTEATIAGLEKKRHELMATGRKHTFI